MRLLFLSSKIFTCVVVTISNEYKIKVFFANRINDSFLNIWLRDHAKDKGSWDSRSNQRKTFTAKINPKISVKNVKIRDFGNSVDIFWSDLKKPINYFHSLLKDICPQL